MEPGKVHSKVKFGPFVADLAAGELLKKGKRVKVQQQPMQVLEALLEKPRQVVTREELRTRVWPEDTFVDFEHSLNTAIKKLRAALGDSPGRPKYVETLPRRGYRFLAAVETSDEVVPVVTKLGGKDVGKIFAVQTEEGLEFVVAPMDVKSYEEWNRLKALTDDVGISMMITEQRLLLVQTGHSVRVLSTEGVAGWCEARILEGEHYGKTAMLPRRNLRADEAERKSAGRSA
jgi:DNA-binding winged helix-turn-helix (wHTH) protein